MLHLILLGLTLYALAWTARASDSDLDVIRWRMVRALFALSRAFNRNAS